MYNDLQDALGYRTDQNAPFNPTYSIASLPVSQLPIDPQRPVPAKALLVPGGVQPDMKTPTLISWSLRSSRRSRPNTSLTFGYVGSHGYHEMIGVDANEPVPAICPASPCPAVYPSDISRARWQARRFRRARITFLRERRRRIPTLANTWTWFSIGDSNYNALQVDVNHRFSHGLSLRGVYTWSKALDDGDSLNAHDRGECAGAGLESVQHERGLGAGDLRRPAHRRDQRRLRAAVRHMGKRFGGGLGAVGAMGWSSGWSVNSIVTLQGGFPFTPQLSYNPSNNGDTRNPVRPFVNPDFTGPVILATRTSGSIPNAFLAPPANSGFYGNLGRDTLDRSGSGDLGFLRLEGHTAFTSGSTCNSARRFSICSIARISTLRT